MPRTHRIRCNLVAALVLGGLASSVFAAERVDKKDLTLKNLAHLEESASTPADFEHLARLYELRTEMLEEKADRHEKLEKRYAAAPASLLAKRGSAWNTPERQRQLAAKARKQAAEAHEMATSYLAKVGSEAQVVD